MPFHQEFQIFLPAGVVAVTNYQVALHSQGLSQAAPLRQSRTANGIVPLKNRQGDNLSPSKFREKTRKEAHSKRFISVQKLQAETQRGKYILSHPQSSFQSYVSLTLYCYFCRKSKTGLLILRAVVEPRSSQKHEKYYEIR